MIDTLQEEVSEANGRQGVNAWLTLRSSPILLCKFLAFLRAKTLPEFIFFQEEMVLIALDRTISTYGNKLKC